MSSKNKAYLYVFDTMSDWESLQGLHFTTPYKQMQQKIQLLIGGGLVVGFCAFWSVLTWQCPCSVPDFGVKSLLFAFLF